MKSGRAEYQILLLTPSGGDAQVIRDRLAGAGFASRACVTVSDLIAALRSGAGAAILAEEALDPNGIAGLGEALAAQPAWSDVPLILLAVPGHDAGPLADHLSRLAHGQVTVLERPVRSSTLLAAVQAALRARQRQYEVRDELERRLAAEAALRENDKRKDEFLAMLAHELRNPLAPIRNAMHIFRQIGPDEPRLERARDIITRQVEHMTRLVDDLLDVSRITRGKIALQRERLAVRDVVDAAVEAIRPLVEQHEQTLSVQITEDVTVDGDRARLVQVLSNLLHNAAKFSPPGGHITVWSRPAPEGVMIAVRDTGIGIAPDAQERIFTMFAQEDTSLERARGGLGIGLTLVKQLVELHGGSVRVSSEGPGTGTEFAIVLPAIGEAAVGEARGGARRPDGQLRILVVEDNADTAESFRMVLELDGHEVHVASDGRKGLRAVDACDPDVVFIDLGLPEIDGLTLARRVREQRGTRPLLVAVSGFGRDVDEQQVREAGFDEQMTKPVDFAVLRALLGRVGNAMLVDERSRVLH